MVYPKVNGESMISDAENTSIDILTGDIMLVANILRIDVGETTDTLVVGFPEGESFWGGDISVDPIYTELVGGSLFSGYVKDSDGNTLESFENEPLIFECIEYYDPWGESLGYCSEEEPSVTSSVWLKSCMGVAASSLLTFLI